MEIGARLKEAREAKNLSLDDVQQTTKIQQRYLQAIEKGNYGIMPGAFYVRAFIKEYAIAVDLDPDELMEEHKSELPAASDESSTEYTRVQRGRKNASSSKSSAIFSFLPTIMIILLVIGIIFAVYYFTQQTGTDGREQSGQSDNNDGADEIIIGDSTDDESGDDSKDNAENQEQEGQTEQGDDNSEDNDNNKGEEESDSEQEPELNVVEEGSGSVPESTIELVNPDEEVTMEFEADGRTYLEVKNGKGQSFFMGELTTDNPSFEQDISNEEQILLNVGNASILDIKINGAVLDYPADPNDYVHQRITINTREQAE